MKIYTEEQVRIALDLSAKGIDLVLCDDILSYVKHIELPSNEEIDKHIEDDFLKSERVQKYTEKEQLLMKATTKAGAKWVIEQIKQQGKCNM